MLLEAAHVGDARPADKACETKVVPTLFSFVTTYMTFEEREHWHAQWMIMLISSLQLHEAHKAVLAQSWYIHFVKLLWIGIKEECKNKNSRIWTWLWSYTHEDDRESDLLTYIIISLAYQWSMSLKEGPQRRTTEIIIETLPYQWDTCARALPPCLAWRIVAAPLRRIGSNGHKVLRASRRDHSHFSLLNIFNHFRVKSTEIGRGTVKHAFGHCVLSCLSRGAKHNLQVVHFFKFYCREKNTAITHTILYAAHRHCRDTTWQQIMISLRPESASSFLEKRKCVSNPAATLSTQPLRLACTGTQDTLFDNCGSWWTWCALLWTKRCGPICQPTGFWS